MATPADPLRAQLVRLLDWADAHVGFDKAVSGLPSAKRGARARGFDHSPWQLVEHMRIAQADILDFCVNRKYVHDGTWPDDYWPRDPAPPTARAWSASIAAFDADRDRMKRIAQRQRDLFAPVPTGSKQQTYLRAILLVADHNAYHLGQLVAVRRAIGAWE